MIILIRNVEKNFFVKIAIQKSKFIYFQDEMVHILFLHKNVLKSENNNLMY